MVPVRRIDHDHIDTRIDKSLDAFERVRRSADRRSDQELPVLVEARVRVAFALQDVRHRHETLERPRRIDQRKLFHAVLVQDFLRLRKADLRRSRHRVLRHHVADLHRMVRNHAEVTARQHPDQLSLRKNRETAHLGFEPCPVGIAHRLVRIERHRVRNDPRLPTLDLADFLGLRIDGHVLVDYAKTALESDRNGERRGGHRIHRRADNRNVQFDICRKLGLHIRLGRQDRGFPRHEQNVVEREGFGK